MFIGQEVEDELRNRLSDLEDMEQYLPNIASEILINNCERHFLATMNLMRIAPVHVINTILEIMRSRYSRHDPSGIYPQN